MIINCTYITIADNGRFESSAKVDTKTGIVFDIETCLDEDTEHIESVAREEIFFKYGNNEYVFEIEYNDKIGEYEAIEFLNSSIIKSINLNKQLNDTLKNDIKSTKNKI